MKKFFVICALAAACSLGQQAQAQSFLKNLLSGASSSSTESSASSSSTSSSTSTQDVLGSALNSLVSSATSSDNSTTSLLGNLISSVTGSATTTQANLIGTWSYTEPSVQFESENLLTQAGGSAIATKVESKLATYYKMVGITAGRVTFTFDESGNVTYTLGSRSFSGTYTFDSSAKTVTIATSTGLSIKAYVTISGSAMSLCFDSSKVLSLFTSLSSSFNKTVSSLAGSYSGMKTGFKFEKK